MCEPKIGSWGFEFNPDQWAQWMNRWQTKSLRNIYDVVHEYLSHGQHLRVEGGARLFQIIISPSWKPTCSYELFRTMYVSSRTKTAFRYLLLKTVWDKESDFERWQLEQENSVIPVLHYVWIGLEQHDVESIAKQIAVDCPTRFNPLDVKTGNDGTLYELSFGNQFLGAKYSWWS